MNTQSKMKKAFWTKSNAPADAIRNLTQVDMNLPTTNFVNTEDLVMKPQKYVTHARFLRKARRLGIAGAAALLIACPHRAQLPPWTCPIHPYF